jgi:SAM-dependent methyltransferase
MIKRYDRQYFDRWYRHPRHRVHTGESLVRKVKMVLSVTEYLLGRPIRSVIDIGCGEGAWRPILRTLRPAVRYRGFDPSPYVLRRFGASRNIRRGSLADLSAVGTTAADLVVCADVLQYVPPAEVERGLVAIRRLARGVAYVEAFAAEDDMEGDQAGWHDRSAAWYRRALRRAGLVQCGPYCFLDPGRYDALNALEHM